MAYGKFCVVTWNFFDSHNWCSVMRSQVVSASYLSGNSGDTNGNVSISYKIIRVMF